LNPPDAPAHEADDVVFCKSRFRNRKSKLGGSEAALRQGEKKMRTKSLAGVLSALLMMSGALAASAQEVTQAEKDKALQYLETTKKNVLEATKGLSEAQWNFKPAPDRWSVAQVMEHIAASEDFIRGMLKEKVMMAPAGEPGRDVKKVDDAVLAMVPDRTTKAQAPEPLVPTNRFGSPEGALKHFVESRATTEDFLKTTTGLRDHVTDSPLGKLDGYEFVLFIAAHSERHTKQINEVKADPNFPKK
jgi:DinB family protein